MTARDDRDRALGEAEAVGERARRRTRSRSRSTTAISRQLDVLDERRLEQADPSARAPSPSRRAVLGDAVARLAEVGDDRLGGHHAQELRQRGRGVSMPRRSRRRRRRRRPRAVGQHQPRARRAASSRRRAAARPRRSRGSSSSSSSRVSERRFSPRSSPTNRATKSSAGCASSSLGRVVLREHAALAQDRDPVADEDRLVDVVRDEDDRLAHLAAGSAGAPAGAARA